MGHIKYFVKIVLLYFFLTTKGIISWCLCNLFRFTFCLVCGNIQWLRLTPTGGDFVQLFVCSELKKCLVNCKNNYEITVVGFHFLIHYK